MNWKHFCNAKPVQVNTRSVTECLLITPLPKQPSLFTTLFWQSVFVEFSTYLKLLWSKKTFEMNSDFDKVQIFWEGDKNLAHFLFLLHNT